MPSASVDRRALQLIRQDAVLMGRLRAAVAAPAVRLCPACVKHEQGPGGLCPTCLAEHRSAA